MPLAVSAFSSLRVVRSVSVCPMGVENRWIGRLLEDSSSGALDARSRMYTTFTITITITITTYVCYLLKAYQHRHVQF